MDRTQLRTTWDGLFISEEPPHGATVLVFRRGKDGRREYLILHRSAATGAPANGDWAWGPPCGARLPGEEVVACARRELDEETGLRLDLHPVDFDPAWAGFWAEAPRDAHVQLSNEHDAYEWVAVDEAMRRCLPAIVSAQFEALAAAAAA
jgi:8-oxo-dGTP pyrophosphatase MutT (NUDIX family)